MCAPGAGDTHLPLSQQWVGLLHCAAALRVEGLGGQYVTLFIEGGTLWRQTPSISGGLQTPLTGMRGPLNRGKGTLMGKEETMDHAQRVTDSRGAGKGVPGASWRKRRSGPSMSQGVAMREGRRLNTKAAPCGIRDTEADRLLHRK